MHSMGIYSFIVKVVTIISDYISSSEHAIDNFLIARENDSLTAIQECVHVYYKNNS